MRILALDVGTKRIGVAVTDPFGWTAQGIQSLERHTIQEDVKVLERLCREYEVERIIVGLPLDQEGGRGKSAKNMEYFQKMLETHLCQQGLSIPVEGWDERYSTAEAEERLIAADVSRKKRRKVIDKMAAVVILESYLRERHHS